MSAPSSDNRPPSLDTHPLVARLHPDPDATANNQVLVGYFGPSKQADHVRLYTDLGFQSYFDIAKADVLGTQAANRQDENSPTVVFVKPDGKAEFVRNQDTGADFLKGAISSANLASAANAGCPVITMTTFCTIGQAPGPNAGCCGTLWTAGCTFPSVAAPNAAPNATPNAGLQALNAAGCPVITMTTFCTIGQAPGPNAGCCGTLWTAGCTFPSVATPQPPPVNTCIQILMTTMCTVGANALQAPNAGCCGTLWTAGCTFPSNA